MRSPSEIKNCSITFQCPKRWDRLEKTADPKVRFCDYCYEPVHLAENEEELRAHAALKRCVAILNPPEPEGEYYPDLVGIIEFREEE